MVLDGSESRSDNNHEKSSRRTVKAPMRCSNPGGGPWLSSSQQRTRAAYLRVQLRMNYEINRQLQRDNELSLADFHVLCALSIAPNRKLQISDLAAVICWERSRLSHHLRRLCDRGLTERLQSEVDARATNVVLTEEGMSAIMAAAPGHARLVRRLFFDPVPDELLSPFTAALEHIQASLNSNSSLPPG